MKQHKICKFGNAKSVRRLALKPNSVLLNFSKKELAELSHAIMNIYQKEFGDLEFYSMINSLKPDEILLREAIV